MLQFVDQFLARHTTAPDLHLLDETFSDAALTLADPESAASPSPAVLVEVESDKERLTGREVEETESRKQQAGGRR